MKTFRWGAALLMTGTLALAAGLMFVLMGHTLWARQQLKNQLEVLGPRSIYVIDSPSNINWSGSLEQALTTSLGVRFVVPIWTSRGVITTDSGFQKSATIVATSRYFPLLARMRFRYGHWWNGKGRMDFVVVNETLASSLHVGMGHDTLMVDGIPARVCGVISNSSVSSNYAGPIAYVSWPDIMGSHPTTAVTMLGLIAPTVHLLPRFVTQIPTILAGLAHLESGGASARYQIITNFSAIRADRNLSSLFGQLNHSVEVATMGMLLISQTVMVLERLRRQRRIIGIAMGFGARWSSLVWRELKLSSLMAGFGWVTGTAAGAIWLGLSGDLPTWTMTELWLILFTGGVILVITLCSTFLSLWAFGYRQSISALTQSHN